MKSRKRPSAFDLVTDAAHSGAPLYLRVGNGTPVAELWLASGRVVGAAAAGADQRLGARLVGTGHLRHAELSEAWARAQGEGLPLSSVLAARVRRDVLEHIARDEARYALAAALEAPAAAIETAQEAPPAGIIPVAIDAPELLARTQEFLDAAREAAEALSPGAVLLPAERPGLDASLSPEEWALLSLADGATSVARLGERCGLPQDEACLLASGLLRQGYVIVDEGAAEASELLAELEAAQDLEAVSAAFEAAIGPSEPEEPVVMIEPEPIVVIEAEPVASTPPALPLPEPIATQEPPMPPVPPVEPHPPAGGRPDAQALLRELASIARMDDAR